APPPPPPAVTAAAPGAAVASAPAATGAPGVRYYSVHREAGRTPDPLPEAMLTGREEISVVLSSPDNPSLAERDRLAAGQERLELDRDLPPGRRDRLLDAPL